MIQLTPPRLITFVVSLVLAGLVLASFYIRIPSIGQFVVQHRLGMLAAAYIVLALGTVLRNL